MRPIQDSDRPTPDPDFETSAVDGEVVLLNPTTLQVAHLNAEAALIWRLCDGNRTVGDLRDLLTAAYPDAAESVRADLASTLRELAALGALGLSTDRDAAGR